MKANEVIRIGRSRSLQASITAETGSLPCVLDLFGILNDKNGVLTGKADEDDKANLSKYVVIHSPHKHSRQRGEETHGDNENDSERQGPALVLRRKCQEHEKDAKRKDEQGGVSCQNLLKRHVGPFKTKARRK